MAEQGAHIVVVRPLLHERADKDMAQIVESKPRFAELVPQLVPEGKQRNHALSASHMKKEPRNVIATRKRPYETDGLAAQGNASLSPAGHFRDEDCKLKRNREVA